MRLHAIRSGMVLVLLAMASLVARSSAGDDSEGDVVRLVLGHQRDWANALVNDDRAAVAAILAEDFTATDSTGHLWNRAAMLDAVSSGLAEIRSIESSDWRVRRYTGSAVVTGRNVVTTKPGRADYAGTYRITNMYIQQDGRWRCVSAHETRVVE